MQLTTLALLAVERQLHRLDGAIFADTGWEPAAVYAHLERVSGLLLPSVAAPIRAHDADRIGALLSPRAVRRD